MDKEKKKALMELQEAVCNHHNAEAHMMSCISRAKEFKINKRNINDYELEDVEWELLHD